LLENLRFAGGEEANDDAFARALASYADVYINDALSTLTLTHASTTGMTRFVSTKGVGLALDREIKNLSKLAGEVERPFVVILGGSNLSERMGFLQSLLGRADAVLIGGPIANTFLKARGGRVGTSFVEGDMLPHARGFLTKAEQASMDVALPSDLVVSGPDTRPGQIVPAMKVPDESEALDIGPDTAHRFAERLSMAHTVFWDGPRGETPSSTDGTAEVAKAVAAIRFGLTVAGGREVAAALGRLGATDRISHISIGGASALELVAGKKLPGLAALES
jgi:phosphoglycerate kinase